MMRAHPVQPVRQFRFTVVPSYPSTSWSAQRIGTGPALPEFEEFEPTPSWEVADAERQRRADITGEHWSVVDLSHPHNARFLPPTGAAE